MPLSKLSPGEQADFFRLVLDSTVEGVCTLNPEGRITMCNAAFLRMFGFSEDDKVIGSVLHDRIHHHHPDGTPYLAADCPLYQSSLNSESCHVPEDIFFRKDGSAFPVECRVQPLRREAGIAGVICTFVDISERVAQSEILANIQRLADSASERIKLANSAGGVIGTWFWDLPLQKVTGDAGFARTFGVDLVAMEKGVSFDVVAQAVHPDDLAGLVAAVEKTMISGETCIIDYRVRSGDGWRWVNATGKAELDDKGQAVSQSGIVIDIDARRRTELALDESHHQLRMAQKVGGIGVFALPADSDELAVSEEFCTIFGLETSPLVSLAETARLVLPEDSEAQSTEDDRAEGTTPSETEYRIRRPNDGEIRWIYRRAEFIRDADGTPSHMVGMVQDITERKTADLRLKESRAYLNLMLESVQDYAIISLDEAGRIVLWNSGAQKTFGYKPQEVLGSHIEVIFTPEDRAHGAPRTELAMAATNTRASDERWHIRQNGERFYASGSMAAMYDEEGRVKGFIKIARDMTAQQQAQEALLEARNAAEAANIAKTEFLANMSHEIRTPMNAIIGLSTILSKSQPLTPRQSDYIRTLSMSADSLLALINDLLDIAKIEARTVELEHIPFSLTRLMQEVASMMAVSVRDKGLTFTGDGECVEERMFIGDPTRLRQIIVNLCSNAIKFTERGGVHVGITCHPSDVPDSEMICLSVTDSGIGIASEKMETIFQKFVQADTSINRKYGGTGLGLAITKTLTEIMGGSISLKSEVGKGSVFEVCIPLKVATSDQVNRTEYSIHAIVDSTVEAHIRPHVLLVEDYEPNILVATTFLEDFGYYVDVANNGMEAFEAVQKRDYVAVLMDVQMHGMNGLDATRRIREWEEAENRTRMRIIGMTAHALAGDRERCLAVGMDDYIPKPFRPEELRRKIEQGQLA
jgi:PAS domain S-box-containing protein